MITKGDKLIAIKDTLFLNEGDVVEVIDVNEKKGMISFAFGRDFAHKGVMHFSKCEECFEKISIPEKVKAPSITSDYIDEIIMNSEITVQTIFDKCTVVACKLPNGFVIVESSACVSPESYDEEMGVDICLEKIANKIWELEGYKLQEELYEEAIENDCPYGCNDCDECECPLEDCDECDLNPDNDTDVNCDDCDDYDCPYNTNDNR